MRFLKIMLFCQIKYSDFSSSLKMVLPIKIFEFLALSNWRLETDKMFLILLKIQDETVFICNAIYFPAVKNDKLGQFEFV